MKIALIGATGNVGSKILTEALSRGHHVTGIVRNIDKLPNHANLTAQQGDVHDEQTLTALLKGHDAVISAVYFSASDPQILINAVRNSGVKRYLVVGGAGSLRAAANGPQLVDTDAFPQEYKAEASKGRDFLNLLQEVKDIDWTFLSPSAEIAPGKRTTIFRLGENELLVDANGKSHISQEDFAVAMIDELEKPNHTQKRFTVGY